MKESFFNGLAVYRMEVGARHIDGKVKDLLADDPFNDLVVDLLNKVSLLLSEKERRRGRCGFRPFVVF
jgi:hypothetical protein